MSYQSQYTGQQIDDAIGVVATLQDTLNELYVGKDLAADTYNSVSTLFTYKHTSNHSNEPAAGFGMKVIWQLDSSTTANQDAAYMQVVWRVATHASRASTLTFHTCQDGSMAPVLYVDHTSFGGSFKPAIGIGGAPSGAGIIQAFLNVSGAGAWTALKAVHEGTTDENGLVISFRTTTTGTGGAAAQELSGFRTIFQVHNHATREAQMEFFLLNGSAAYEVWKFRKGFTFGYGDLTSASFTRLLATRKTGWTLPTGTASRATFATATVTTEQLAQRVMALLEDLHVTAGHGLIGT